MSVGRTTTVRTRVVIAAGAAASVAALVAAGGSASATTSVHSGRVKTPSTSTFATPNGGFGVGYDSSRHVLWVSGNTGLTAYSSKTHQALGVFTSQLAEGKVAVDTSNHRVVVSDTFKNVVTIVNGQTGKLVGSIPLASPSDLAINSKTHRVYVVSTSTNRIVDINDASGKVVKKFVVKRGPTGVAVDPTHNLLFATFQGVLSTNGFYYHGGVAFMSGKSGKIQHEVKPPYTDDLDQPDGLAYNAKSHTIYFLNHDDIYSNIWAVSSRTHKVTNSNVAAVAYANGVVWGPSSHVLYVTYSNDYGDDVSQGFDLVTPAHSGATPANVRLLSDNETNQVAVDPKTPTAWVTGTIDTDSADNPVLMVVKGQ